MYDPDMQVETARLILRQPRLSDLEAWAQFMADPEAANHIGGVQPRSVVWRSLAAMAGAWAIAGFGMFSVLEKSSGEWIGRLGPWNPDGWPGTEVGWGIRREYWGRGYACEGSIAAIDWAFAQLGWSRGHSHDRAGEPELDRARAAPRLHEAPLDSSAGALRSS